jgi:nucleotide-binding universal stress UspA family protein
VDDSDAALDAAALGYRLADALGRDVLLAHVYSLHAQPSESRVLASARMREFAEQRPSRERRTAVVPARSAAKGLRALAAQEDAVAVVVGSSSSSTLGRLLAGRTSERLLTNASVPVAIAPAGYAETESPIATIGSAFDGSPNSRLALDWAAATARSAGASLRILGVHEPVPVDRLSLTSGLGSPSFTRVIREQQEKRLALGAVEVGAGLSVAPELRDGNTADMLVDASRTLDLLVLGSRGLGRFRGAILGSVSAAVVRAAHSPVVVVPAPSQ